MEEKRIYLPVFFALLALITIPSSKQTSLLAKENSWETVQAPKIPGGTISQMIIDPLDSSHLFAFQRQQYLSYVLFESRDAAETWKAIYTFQDFIYHATIDPSNPSILYASTSNAILRSTNGGRSWGKIAHYGQVIASPATNVLYSIELLPYNDDCPTGYVNFVASHNGGDTWEKYPLGCFFIHEISTTTSHPDWIYIRAEYDFGSAIYRSSDGGDTWTVVPLLGEWFTHGFVPLAVDPSNPEKLFTSSGSGIIVSTNGGLTWRSVLDISMAGPFRFTFANGVIYAGVDPVIFGDLPVVYRSVDGGETWETLPWTMPDRLNDLLSDPCRPGWLLAALNGFGVYRSEDGGQSWQASNEGMRSAVRVEKMAISQSTPDTIFAISDWPRNTLLKTGDRGQTWSNPLLETMVFSIAVHPDKPDVVWVADQGGILESVDGGERWRRVTTLPVYDLAVSPDAPERPCGIGSSSDGGYLLCREIMGENQEIRWEKSLIPGVQSVGWLSMSPTQSNIMLLSGGSGDPLNYSIFRSQNGGQSWEEIFRGPEDYFVLNLVVSGSRPARVFVVFFQYHPDNLLIFQSLDAGETWENITGKLTEAGGEMWTGWTYKAPIVFDSAGVPFFGTRDVILQELGGGQTWETAWDKKDLIQDMIVLPGSQEYLLVSTEQNLWRSQLPIFRSMWMPVVFRQP